MQIEGQDIDIDTSVPIDVPVNDGLSVAPKEVSVEDSVKAAFEKHRGPQSRDDAGRFANVDPSKTVEIAAPTNPAATPLDPNAVQIAPVISQAPASWGQKNADLWSKLPPDAQSFIAKREDDVNRGFARYSGVAEYADMAEQSGTTLKEALGRYTAYEKAMEDRPVETLLNLAALYQIKPQQIMAALGSAGQAPQGQPQAAQFAQPDPRIQQELQALKSQLTEMRMEPVKQSVEQFFADPANKYADQLSESIAAILTANPDADLKSAYEQACWMDASVRAELLKDRQDEWQKSQIPARAPQAPQAARSLSPSPVERTSNAFRKGMSVEETVAAAVRQST